VLEPDPREQAVLELIRRLRAMRFSVREIRALLEDWNLPARGSRWHLTTVARILRRQRAEGLQGNASGPRGLHEHAKSRQAGTGATTGAGGGWLLGAVGPAGTEADRNRARRGVNPVVAEAACRAVGIPGPARRPQPISGSCHANPAPRRPPREQRLWVRACAQLPHITRIVVSGTLGAAGEVENIAHVTIAKPWRLGEVRAAVARARPALPAPVLWHFVGPIGTPA